MTKNWPGELDSYGVQIVVLDLAGDSDLVERFQSEPGWRVDFDDGEAIIFARDPAFARDPVSLISSETSFEGIISEG
jgi:hypothetical protein